MGGTGNSLRRTGTGVLRLRLTDMVEESRGEVCRTTVCAFAPLKAKRVVSKSDRRGTKEKT